MRLTVVPIPLLLLLGGCVPSLQPLFTERDLVFDSGLVGTWKDTDGDTTWVVRQAGPKAYQAAETEKGETHKFSIHLVRLGDQQFVDLQPGERLGFKNETFQSHFIAAHTFYRFSRTGDVVKVYALEEKFLKRLMAEKKITITQMFEDAVVLIGSTAQLQEHLLKYAGEPAAFTDALELRRVQ
jgi:hypothetical protein